MSSATQTPTVAPSSSTQLLTAIKSALEVIVRSLPDTDPEITDRVLSRPVLVPPAHPFRRSTDRPQADAPAVITPHRRRADRTYHPRVTYRVLRPAPQRNPLPESTAIVYDSIAKHPNSTARELQTRLSLRDGQLWGALRRLTLARLIRAIPAK